MAWIGLAVTVVAIAVGAYFLIAWPYRNAESQLRAELHRLRPRLGTLVSDAYRDGVCLDNCPELVREYRSDDVCRSLRHAVAALVRHGYSVHVYGGRLSAWRGDRLNAMVDTGVPTCRGAPASVGRPGRVVLFLDDQG